MVVRTRLNKPTRHVWPLAGDPCPESAKVAALVKLGLMINQWKTKTRLAKTAPQLRDDLWVGVPLYLGTFWKITAIGEFACSGTQSKMLPLET